MSSTRHLLHGAGAGGLLVLVIGGCTLQPYTQYGPSGAADATTGSTVGGTEGAATAGTDTTGSTTATPTTGGATTTAGSSGSDVSTTAVGPADLPPASEDCEVWSTPSPDCRPGQKCTIEGSLSDTHCVDVVDDPKDMWEPCQRLMGDELSGFDDCGPGMVCWDVDPNTGMGICVGFCHGTPRDPSCVDPAAGSCTLCPGCVGLCLPMCDPLQQDCPDGGLCIPDPQDPAEFICVLDASGAEGQAFDPCEFANACDPGHICVDPGFGVECDALAIGCCLPLCDTAMPVCPGAGQECLPWYEVGMAPPGFEHVGVCGMPL